MHAPLTFFLQPHTRLFSRATQYFGARQFGPYAVEDVCAIKEGRSFCSLSTFCFSIHNTVSVPSRCLETPPKKKDEVSCA